MLGKLSLQVLSKLWGKKEAAFFIGFPVISHTPSAPRRDHSDKITEKQKGEAALCLFFFLNHKQDNDLLFGYTWVWISNPLKILEILRMQELKWFPACFVNQSLFYVHCRKSYCFKAIRLSFWEIWHCLWSSYSVDKDLHFYTHRTWETWSSFAPKCIEII